MIDGSFAPQNAWHLPGLAANEPDPVLKDRLMLYGQFIGDWEIVSRWYRPDGSRLQGKGTVHFRWILQGTAIQDVWIGQITDPQPEKPKILFGTTIRFYDPKAETWRIVWVDTQAAVIQLFTAHRVGDEIVMEGSTPDGSPERWIYSEITPLSFEWRAEESADGGKTWRLTQHISARRSQL